MSTMKTPGVYVVEKNAFPNSVVEVATAVPAFIGYTQNALNGNKSLINKPWRITSMAEYQAFFGGAPTPQFKLEKSDAAERSDLRIGGADYRLELQKSYTLYYNMVLFFANGGGPCYIVSVGDYDTDLDKGRFTNGIAQLVTELEPTLVAIPEAVNLPFEDCLEVQNATLNHCGYETRSRFALLDVPQAAEATDSVKAFREGITSNFLDFGAAYYPWLNTTITQDGDLSFANIGNPGDLRQLLEDEASTNKASDELNAIIAAIGEDVGDMTTHKVLYQVSATYRDVLKIMKERLNTLPASAAIAGVYTMVDNTKGVWKAPANVGLVGVVSPATNISHAQQEDLNVPLSGKAVNAIRTFVGEGIKVWGARTLDGNSLDWRYVNVRRTVIMLEESIKNAARAYVFEANTANTWVNVRSMIGNFLTGIWKRGGLAGSTPEEAFNVSVGLGETMTPNDVLEGIMRVSVRIAVVRPAEFIEITFQQQMQES